MITLHSIDLKMTNEPCFGLIAGKQCRILISNHEHCGSYKCPFYKPKGCRDWIRVDDRRGSNLIPPEEYAFAVRRRHEQRTDLRK